MILGLKGTALLGVRPADNAAALGVLLVMLPPVENLTGLLSSEILLSLHSLRLGSLAVTAGTPLVLTLSPLVRLLGRTPAMLASASLVHGFRHYTVSGENHDRSYRRLGK